MSAGDQVVQKSIEGNVLEEVEALRRDVDELKSSAALLESLDSLTENLGIVRASDIAADGVHTNANVVDINWWVPLNLADDVVTRVRALVYDGVEYVYVGGDFTRIGGVAANYIARYSLITRNWSEVNGGVNAPVYAIAITNTGAILIGGSFTNAGGVANADGIAITSGSTWAALGTGASAGSTVLALAVDSANNYYAAGSFTLMGGVANTSGVAKWTGAAWTAMGTGASAGGRALAINSADEVYLGTTTLNIGGVANADYIGKWSAGAWSGLGSGTSDGVYALAVDSNDVLYVGGAFTSVDPGINPITCSGIASYSSGWAAVGVAGVDTGIVYAIAIDANDFVVIGGSFGDVDDVEGTSRIAIWDGAEWGALSNGGGVTTVAGKEVNGLLVLPSNSVVAGGIFDYVGAIACNGIAQWCKPLNEAFDIAASLLELYAQRSWSGWIPDVVTWTYASASAFTIQGDKTLKLRVGTRIKCVNSGAKQGYVSAVSYAAGTNLTTVTVSFVVANAVITEPFYSYILYPEGYAGPTVLTSAVIGTGGDTIDLAKSGSLTPTIIGTTTSGIGTYTSQLGEFYVMGKIVFYEIELVWTAHTGTGNMRIEGLPYTSKSNDIFVPSAVYWSNLTLLAVGNKVLAIVMPNTTKISIYEIGNGASSVLPMDAAGSLRVSGFYIRA